MGAVSVILVGIALVGGPATEWRVVVVVVVGGGVVVVVVVLL